MKRSPLNEKHIALNAKMADFGGWMMPIEYPGAGVLAEHAAVRDRVGLFDVSHLGKASVIGEGALEFLNLCLIKRLKLMKNGCKDIKFKKRVINMFFIMVLELILMY